MTTIKMLIFYLGGMITYSLFSSTLYEASFSAKMFLAIMFFILLIFIEYVTSTFLYEFVEGD